MNFLLLLISRRSVFNGTNWASGTIMLSGSNDSFTCRPMSFYYSWRNLPGHTRARARGIVARPSALSRVLKPSSARSSFSASTMNSSLAWVKSDS